MTESKQKQETYAIIVGVIYIIPAIFNFIIRYTYGRYDYCYQLVEPVLLVGMAATLFIKNKKAVAFAAGANALFCIIGFALIIRNIFSATYLDSYYSPDLFYLLKVPVYLFEAFAYTALIVISVVPFKKAQTIKKLWYIPGILFLLGTIICFFICSNLMEFLQLAVESIALFLTGLWLKVDFYTAKEDVTTQATLSSSITIGDADKIMMYKELLDNGTITQEEFDIKKKEILGN